jgi:hypothetical protein
MATNIHVSTYALTMKLTLQGCPALWWIMAVYGPQLGRDKVAFLQELRAIHSGRLGPWLLGGISILFTG